MITVLIGTPQLHISYYLEFEGRGLMRKLVRQ